MNQNPATDLPLGIQPVSGQSGPPMTEEDWKKRQQKLREMGFTEDSWVMQGAEWRQGLAADREGMREGVRSSVRQSLGLNAADTATKAGAAAGSSSLLSSL